MSSLLTLLALTGCAPSETAAPTNNNGPAGGDLAAIMGARGLTDADIVAAAKTYTPSVLAQRESDSRVGGVTNSWRAGERLG